MGNQAGFPCRREKPKCVQSVGFGFELAVIEIYIVGVACVSAKGIVLPGADFFGTGRAFRIMKVCCGDVIRFTRIVAAVCGIPERGMDERSAESACWAGSGQRQG